ncbi:hypothetical protein FQZ97_403990 [compost metagenome]
MFGISLLAVPMKSLRSGRSTSAPEFKWNGRLFVFTGVMAYGPRKDCEALVIVIGTVGNEQWLHSTYGTKITKAVELRESGAQISIVSEEHWQKAVLE